MGTQPNELLPSPLEERTSHLQILRQIPWSSIQFPSSIYTWVDISRISWKTFPIFSKLRVQITRMMLNVWFEKRRCLQSPDVRVRNICIFSTCLSGILIETKLICISTKVLVLHIATRSWNNMPIITQYIVNDKSMVFRNNFEDYFLLLVPSISITHAMQMFLVELGLPTVWYKFNRPRFQVLLLNCLGLRIIICILQTVSLIAEWIVYLTIWLLLISKACKSECPDMNYSNHLYMPITSPETAICAGSWGRLITTKHLCVSLIE